MPEGKELCEHAPAAVEQVHWTALLVSCPVCDDDIMSFTNYIQGEHILDFYEQCVDQKKLAHSPLMWLNEVGHHCLHLSWPGNDFSAS